jgi:hypothetical protein
MIKEKLGEYLFYISLIIFLFAPFSASIGIVESKFWIEYRIPAFGVALTFFAFYMGLKTNINKLINN